jgi:hypothetical protein
VKPSGKKRVRKTAPVDPCARVRAICLALPESTEKIAWGAPTFRVKDRMFAMYVENHHGDGRIALWLPAPKGAQVVLAGAEPDRFFVPPYVGTKGWIGLHLLAHGDEELRLHVRRAYLMVAPKRLRAGIEADSDFDES